MAINEEYLAYILDQLSEFGDVNSRKMFGGSGLFSEGMMFGMIGGDVFRLKVDDHNRADYEAKGMKPYASGKKKKGMPYWEVPANVVEDKSELVRWAAKSLQAAHRSKK